MSKSDLTLREAVSCGSPQRPDSLGPSAVSTPSSVVLEGGHGWHLTVSTTSVSFISTSQVSTTVPGSIGRNSIRFQMNLSGLRVRLCPSNSPCILVL